jgi:hypothetical protein
MISAVLPSIPLETRGFLYPLTIGDEVNFRLTYDGPLKAASQSDPRRLEKHEIRRVFNRQLDELYLAHNNRFLDAEQVALAGQKIPTIQHGAFTFTALVREKLNLVCDLDILFLRRDDPGKLIRSGGDLDNRIKVLFDALRIPQDDNEVRDIMPQGEDERLFLCLTEDDKLITGFRVTTDRLLEPATSHAEENHVRLIVNVEVKATMLTAENISYLSHF